MLAPGREPVAGRSRDRPDHNGAHQGESPRRADLRGRRRADALDRLSDVPARLEGTPTATMKEWSWFH